MNPNTTELQFLKNIMMADALRMQERRLYEAKGAGFETVEEHYRFERHWRSPWGRFKKLVGVKPPVLASLNPPIKWRRNSVKIRRTVTPDTTA